jgi:hypothetical protein
LFLLLLLIGTEIFRKDILLAIFIYIYIFILIYQCSYESAWLCKNRFVGDVIRRISSDESNRKWILKHTDSISLDRNIRKLDESLITFNFESTLWIMSVSSRDAIETNLNEKVLLETFFLSILGIGFFYSHGRVLSKTKRSFANSSIFLRRMS